MNKLLEWCHIIALSVLTFLLYFSAAASAKTIYLKSGDEIDAVSAWKKGAMVCVLVNRDTLLDFPAEEVNLKKTLQPGAKEYAAPKQARLKRLESRSGGRGVSPELVDRVLEASGIAKQLDQLPALASRSALVNDQDPAKARSISNIVENCFDPDEARKSMRDHFIRHGDPVTLNNVLHWLQSPTGRKILEPPVILDENLLMNLKLYELELEGSPAGRRRLAIIRQIVRETRLVESLGETIEMTIDSFADVAPGSKEQKSQLRNEVKHEMKKTQPQLATMMQRLLVNSYAYMYRDLSEAELSDYAGFLRSESGRRFLNLSNAAQMKIVKRMIKSMQKYMAEQMRV